LCECAAAQAASSCSLYAIAWRPVDHDEITTIDHALTRPWMVMKSCRRETNPIWIEYDCNENNIHACIVSHIRKRKSEIFTPHAR
jgi:hypothetical protein